MSHLNNISFDNYRNLFPISDGVHTAIKDAIFTGLLCPGEHFTENAVAEQFGISRTPAREGLTRLENEGFLASVSRKGFVVCSIRMEDGRELYNLAIVLEPYAAAEAARNRSQLDLDKMEALLFDDSSSMDGISKINYSFHLLIARASGNKLLFDFIQQVRERLLLLNSFTSLSEQYSSPEECMIHTRAAHKRIMQAIADQDGEFASILARRHMEDAQMEFLSSIRNEDKESMNRTKKHKKKESLV